MIAVGFHEKGMIPATTTMLTFCPGHIATNLGGQMEGGKDPATVDETFTFATSDKYVNNGGCPVYHKQKDVDPEVNP